MSWTKQGFKDWIENQKANHKILKELAHCVNGKEKSEISREILFYKYINFIMY